jgi:4-hydroxy-2-oxoheptanedioate aldolase
MQNPLKLAWAQERATLGGWLTIPSSFSAELMAKLAFDWLTIDMQHGLIGYQQALEMLQAISTSDTTPLVRVPWNEPGIIGKMLDAGAMGVIVPMVNSRAEAEAAVAACRYPPDGKRSFGPMRAALTAPEYFRHANAAICCIPMVETREALDNLDDILSVPGVDAIYVGPNDLSLSLGLGPGADHDDEVFRDALEEIVAGCRRHGVVPGVAGSAQIALQRLQQGFVLVEVSRDSGAMASAAAGDLKSVRAELKGGSQ